LKKQIKLKAPKTQKERLFELEVHQDRDPKSKPRRYSPLTCFARPTL